MNQIPELEHYCGSWIITRIATGEVIGEFYERANVLLFDQSKCLIQTAAQYLAGLNK